MPKPCEGCGKPIQFARHEKTGNWIPLEKIQGFEFEEGSSPKALPFCRDIYINHYVTCPKRDQFRKGTRDTKPKQGELMLERGI